jgi:hypothetical protein
LKQGLLPRPLDRLGKAVGAYRLDKVIERTGFKSRGGVVGVRRDHDAERPSLRSRDAQNIESAHVRQANVKEHHVGTEFVGGVYCRNTALGFPDNIHIGAAVAELDQGGSRQRFVIHDEQLH